MGLENRAAGQKRNPHRDGDPPPSFFIFIVLNINSLICLLLAKVNLNLPILSNFLKNAVKTAFSDQLKLDSNNYISINYK